jgi:hypothetical protein
MMLKYQSGEGVRLRDEVTFGGKAATVELVVVGLNGDPENDWQFETNGPGVLVVEAEPATLFGRMYMRNPETKNDLLLIARATGA